MKRCFGIAFGLANQLLFVLTVARLFVFLKGGHATAAPGPLWLDLLLAAQFAVPHSLLLWPPVRQRLRRWIATEFYGCAFCTATCLCLLVAIGGWRSDATTIWKLDGVAAGVIDALFIAVWAALFYSLWLSGLGRHTGWTTWYAWLRRVEVANPEFQPRSWYRWLRHPIYLSFLGLIWLTPRMTADRLVLALCWTAYIFIGSWFKDRRLEQFIGEPYRQYAAVVPGFPFFPGGPLGRRRAGPPAVSIAPASLQRAA